MPLKYRIDILKELKNAGFNTTKLRKERLLSEGAIQAIREERPISWASLEKICSLLKCQPGDIVIYLDENGRDSEGFLHLIPRKSIGED